MPPAGEIDMARVRLEVDDPALRLTLKAMLENEGHIVGPGDAEVCICDSALAAVAAARTTTTLLLTNAMGVAEAVAAMRKGVLGYIHFPLVPGEAALMVQRALSGPETLARAAATPQRLDAVERAHIEAVLRQCKHNQAEAARVLGIGRNTLWRKLKQYSEVAS